MKLETFFEDFEVLAEMPGAVGKLRELVLELAIAGKLVAQDPDDEPVDALVKNIEFERSAKGTKEYPPVNLAEAPFQIPDSWTWLRLGNVSLSSDSGWSPQCDSGSRSGTDWGVLKVSAVSWGKFKPDENKALPPGIAPRPECEVKSGDFLLSRANTEDLVARGVVVNTTPPRLMMSDKIVRFTFPAAIDPRFINLANASTASRAYYARNASGTSSSMKNISREVMCNLPIPVPPLAEQKRIVAKFDEVMALCDRLEAQQQERETRHTALSRASLAQFTDAPTPANLSVLFHPTYAIPPADLRKSILTLAVQGKLAPQDPNDEPAQDLAARIARERARIVTEQQVRLPKAVPPITGDDCAHEVPESWQWSRIGQLALAIDYGTSQKADDDSSKVPVYRMGNIVGGRLVDENLKYVDESIDDLPGLYLKTGDILFNRTNSYELVGKTGIYTGPADTATFASYLIRIRLPDTLLFPPFFGVVMNAPYYRQTQIEPNVVQQCGQANFNGTKLAATVVPLPPLAEQRRIVAKVEQLMAALDEMETQLNLASARATKILAAISISLRAS